MEEKDSIALHCPLQSVKGKVTWSREINGSKVDILIVDGDRDIRLVHDRYKRYSSLADKSLHIFRAAVSDTAKYLCNNEPAAELTVIPSGNSLIYSSSIIPSSNLSSITEYVLWCSGPLLPVSPFCFTPLSPIQTGFIPSYVGQLSEPGLLPSMISHTRNLRRCIENKHKEIKN